MDEILHKKLIHGWYCCPPDPDPDLEPEPGEGGGDPTGDDSPYTDEELKILGGHLPTDGEPDPASSPEPEGGGDPEPEPALEPWQKEIAELKQTIEELKGAKPAPGKEEPKPESAPAAAKDPRNAKVEYDDPAHKYHGKTLGQIYDIDPDEAFAIAPRLSLEIYHGEREAKAKEEQEQREAIAQVEKERSDFRSEYAALEFDKPLDKLDSKDRAVVDAMDSKVVDWMKENGKFGVTVSEAYFLMDRANIMSKISSKATDKVIKDATHGTVKTIHTKKDGGADKGGGADMTQWTEDQMVAYIDTLSGPEYTKFLSSAPQQVKAKFTSLPWD